MNLLKQKVFTVVVPVIAVVAVIAAGYFYSQVRMLKQDPQVVAQKEAEALVKKVGRLLVLPAEEVPTVATVSDPEALKDQAFFAKAAKGDKVLIYTTAKKAILYSPEMDRVVDVAPLNIGNQKAVTPPKPAASTSSTDEE